MELSLLELALVAIATILGAIVQGAIGFGFALVAIPVITLLEPAALPATVLYLSLPMTGWMAFREREAIDVRGFVEITIARLPGVILAVLVLGLVAADKLTAVIGGVILLAVGLSLFTPDFELRTRWRVLAGLLSGFMATVAAVGGPLLAIAYQRRPGSQLRSTLAVTFVVGSVVSLTALAIGDHVVAGHLVLALKLVPAMAVGLFLATKLHGLLDERRLRAAVLTFAAIAGVAAILKAFL